ncbi:hypothetical protein [Prevotella sp. 10(H)]|uniref:hypothetical protein n=1 Tax=Prevotella sp. 10(H) TaxID=1158294 RepID=UPI0009DE61DA|nr:hypothetical protein [Prevotella sp. 10(H)]
MLNEKIKALLRIALPVLFITYACSITFFTHTHIVNGVTIVHSHPYSTDDEGKPAHEHSGAEIQLIHTLSTFYIAGLIILAVVFGIFRVRKQILCTRILFSIPVISVNSLFRLRAPPVL